VTPRLRLRGIGKRYGELIANQDIDLDVAPGEIHAVLGENGAGKSTLMKIVYGVTQPDQGSIEWQGSPVAIVNPAAARALGIGMVFQHFALFETLTVAENIALALDGNPAPATLAARIHEVSHRYGLPVDPGRLTHGMSVGERQRVEIVRCLLQDPKLLIMDEPTSVLTPQAVQALFETLRRLSAEGLSILYISHKLDEIRALCTNATVLRGGRVTGRADPRAESNESLARLMVGRELRECTLNPREPGDVRLQVESLSLASDDPFGTSLHEVSLAVRSGEIVGIAGVSGNGQKELLAALAGERRCTPHTAIRLDGDAVGALGPAERRGRGLRYVPEERLGRATVPPFSLADNCLLDGEAAGLLRGGVLRRRAARAFARETIRDHGVKCAGEQSPARSLSGGNLQKFIVGREIRMAPRVLLVAQPTWGVDVNAALGVRQRLIDLRNAGCAVLVISEDLDELYSICDRLAVISHGRLSVAEATARLPVEVVGLLMTAQPSHA
jgi:simple sugar transport system ATP-binding protein